jgi:hypothetical protein
MSSTEENASNTASSDMPVKPAANSSPRIAVFRMPSAASFGIELALHRRRNRWYVVLPRAYGMAESRWWADLNHPRPTDPPSTGPPTSHPHLHHRFWFNSNHVTLDDILKAEPPVLKVTGISRMEKAATVGSDTDVTVEANQVEVLISEDELCRRCAFCGLWEVSNSNYRYEKVGQDGDDRIYWCGVSEYGVTKTSLLMWVIY